jgi:hypothetical protein
MVAETFRPDGTLWTSRRISAGLDNCLATHVSDLTGLPAGGYIALPKKEITPLDALLYSASLPDVYLRFQPTVTFAAPGIGSTMLTPRQSALFTIGRLNDNSKQSLYTAASFEEGWNHLQQEEVVESIRQKMLYTKAVNP